MLAMVRDELATEQTITRAIYCNCQRWLAELTVVLGHRQRHRLSRCTRCHSQHRPPYPVVFVDEEGRYCIIHWWCPVDANTLPWPGAERGWR